MILDPDHLQLDPSVVSYRIERSCRCNARWRASVLVSLKTMACKQKMYETTHAIFVQKFKLLFRITTSQTARPSPGTHSRTKTVVQS